MVPLSTSFLTAGVLTENVKEVPFTTVVPEVIVSLGLLPFVIVIAGSVPQDKSPSAALAGTTVRLSTIVRANSKERNFFM